MPSDFDPNDPVLCNSHFALNVIILFWLFWYFTHLVRLYKPLYGQVVTLTFSIFQHVAFFFRFTVFSFLSPLSLIFSATKHSSEDDNSEDAWLDLFLLEELGNWVNVLR